MIKTRLGNLVNAEGPLNKLIQATLPIKAAYSLKKLATAVDGETRYFHEQKQKFIQDLGTAEGDVVTVTEANVPEYRKRILELLDVEVELSVKPLDLSTLGEYAISAVDLSLLEAITVMPED